MTPNEGPPALPAARRRRPRRRMLEGTAVVVALLAVALPIAISAGGDDPGTVDASLAAGRGVAVPVEPGPADRPGKDVPVDDRGEPGGPDPLGPDVRDGLDATIVGPDGSPLGGLGTDVPGVDGLEAGLLGDAPDGTPDLGAPGGPAGPDGPLPPLMQTLPEIKLPSPGQAPQFSDSPPLPPTARRAPAPPAPPVQDQVVAGEKAVEAAPLPQRPTEALPRVQDQVAQVTAPPRHIDRPPARPSEYNTLTESATGVTGTPRPGGQPLVGSNVASTPGRPAPAAPAAPARPTPAPAITAVKAGAVPTLPAGAGWGSPVVVTGRDLQRAEYWSVGGRRVEPVRRSAAEVLLMVPPGTATGQVAWHAGGRSEAHSLNLGSVLPAATGARPIVWGAGCATPAATGLVWVAGRIGDGVDVTSRTGERTIGDRSLRDGSVLATVGGSPPPSIVVKRGGWSTIVPVDKKTVDVSALSALPALTGNDCPMSGGTSHVGIVTTGAPRDLKGLYTGTPERTPLRYVVISDDAIVVLLPRGAAAGTREVVVKGADGKMWRRPLQVVRPADGAVTTLADQMQKRS